MQKLDQNNSATYAILTCADLVRRCDPSSHVRKVSLVRDGRGLIVCVTDGKNAIRFDFAEDAPGLAALPPGVWTVKNEDWPPWGAYDWRLRVEVDVDWPSIACDAYTAKGRQATGRSCRVRLHAAPCPILDLWDRLTVCVRTAVSVPDLAGVLEPLHDGATIELSHTGPSNVWVQVMGSTLGAMLRATGEPFSRARISVAPLEFALGVCEPCGDPVVLHIPTAQADQDAPILLRAGFCAVVVAQTPQAAAS